jgi:hypothetical protein
MIGRARATALGRLCYTRPPPALLVLLLGLVFFSSSNSMGSEGEGAEKGLDGRASDSDFVGGGT